MTVHILECCSCLNVGLKHTEWGKAAGRRLGREGLEKVDRHRKGQERSTKGFILPLDGGEVWGGMEMGLHPFRPSKKRKNKKQKTQTPCQTERAIM